MDRRDTSASLAKLLEADYEESAGDEASDYVKSLVVRTFSPLVTTSSREIYLVSKDDELQGDSNSIANQKRVLMTYAQENGFPNPRFFIDDGWSGANIERPSYIEMMELVEVKKIGTILLLRRYISTKFVVQHVYD